QILELEKKVVRQNQIAVNVKQVNCSKRLQKKIEALETHLNNVTVHFNTILTGNNKLQEEIENLRTQKAVLDNSYMKLHKKLDQQMRRMNAAIEQSAQAHKQWYVALQTLCAMKEQHNKDTVHFNTEMRERKRVLVQNAQVKNFMLTKSRNRSEMEKQAKEKKALKVAQRVKQRQSVSHEVAYRRLMELAEDGDIDRLVNGFIEREGKNLSCFSYATKLSSEMNKIHQKIEDLQVCSRLFVSPLSQLVLLAWGGFFLCRVSSITAHTRARLIACHTGGIRGMQRESQKYNSNSQNVAFSELKVSQCCHRVPSKNTAVSRRAKSCLSCVQGLAGARSACCGVVICPPGLGTAVPRGAKWDIPAPRAEGWSPASVRHVWWAYSQRPLRVLVFTQNEITAIVMDRERAESSNLRILKELEVCHPGIPSARAAEPCLVLSVLLWPTPGEVRAEKGPASARAARSLSAWREATAGFLPALVLQHLRPHLWHRELEILHRAFSPQG
uniref:ODAD1 central coiled coil region domain-containing protein n=1 Tax=Athene cunicularia TaxID=194338 RepID=A0A663MPB0_ATHCN